MDSQELINEKLAKFIDDPCRNCEVAIINSLGGKLENFQLEKDPEEGTLGKGSGQPGTATVVPAKRG